MKVQTYKPRGRDKWVFRLHGRDVPTPSRQVQRGGFATEAEAQREGRKVARQIDEGTFVVRHAESVAAFLDAWIDVKRPALKPSVQATYADAVRVHLNPRIGDHRVQELKPEHVARLYAELLANGRIDGRGGLGAKTVRNIAAVLSGALDDAVKWGRVQRNVCDVVDLPRWERPAIRTWTSAQMRAFLTATSSSRDGAAWRLLLTTGCRRGELGAFRWRHVDLDRGKLTIETARVKAGSQTVEGSPKSRASRRTISIDPGTIAALRAWKRRQAGERLAAGEGWWGAPDREDDFVMADELGRPLAPNTITRHWTAAIIRAGLPLIRLHDARHTYATVALMEAGERDKVISERLGHSDIATTQRLYAHVRERDDRRAADAVASLLD